MSNHYHLLLETPAGNLAEIMRHLNGAYTTYFNVKRKRSGHLLQGRYKAILVEADEYATELSRYIHLNPVNAGMVVRPEEYQWSSYRSYIGDAASPAWLKTDFILGYFSQKTVVAGKKYRLFVEEMLGKEYESPLKSTVGSSLLGSPGFIEEITTVHLKDKTVGRDVPAVRHLTTRPLPEEIIGEINKAFPENGKLARQAAMHLCHRYSGSKLKEIGNYFAVRESAITEGSRRFAAKLEEDEELRNRVEKVKTGLRI